LKIVSALICCAIVSHAGTELPAPHWLSWDPPELKFRVHRELPWDSPELKFRVGRELPWVRWN